MKHICGMKILRLAVLLLAGQGGVLFPYLADGQNAPSDIADEGNMLWGRVLYWDGRPAENAYILVRYRNSDNAIPSSSTTCDKNGCFEMTQMAEGHADVYAAPGKYASEVMPHPWKIRTTFASYPIVKERLYLKGSSHKNFVILPPHMLRGHVTYAPRGIFKDPSEILCMYVWMCEPGEPDEALQITDCGMPVPFQTPFAIEGRFMSSYHILSLYTKSGMRLDRMLGPINNLAGDVDAGEWKLPVRCAVRINATLTSGSMATSTLRTFLIDASTQWTPIDPATSDTDKRRNGATIRFCINPLNASRLVGPLPEGAWRVKVRAINWEVFPNELAIVTRADDEPQLAITLKPSEYPMAVDPLWRRPMLREPTQSDMEDPAGPWLIQVYPRPTTQR